jgi:hypothetical protein
LTPRYWRNAPASAIQSAPISMPAMHASVVPSAFAGSVTR